MFGEADSTNEPDRSEDEYPLAPPDPDLTRYPPAVYPVCPDEVPEPPAKLGFQFSLAEMLLGTAVVAFVLGMTSYLPGGYTTRSLAAIAGLAVLTSMVVLELVGTVRPIVRLGWWALLVAYVLACLAAMITGA